MLHTSNIHIEYDTVYDDNTRHAEWQCSQPRQFRPQILACTISFNMDCLQTLLQHATLSYGWCMSLIANVKTCMLHTSNLHIEYDTAYDHNTRYAERPLR